MVNVKIECGCGQPYAFDIEPADWQPGSTVACPSCGTDGTVAANAIIGGKLPPTLFPSAPAVIAAAPPETGTRLKFTGAEHRPPQPPAGVKVDARTLGLVDRTTAETEARAKISWGDSQDDVIKFLMLQGFSVPEATELVQELFQERLVALRAKGVRKIVTGVGMMCVPVIAYGLMSHVGMISFRLLALPVMVGVYGCWQALNGVITLAAPKMESGDVVDD